MTAGDLVTAEHSIAAEPRQALLSPEQVELELPIAGPTSRMLAYAIDQVMIVALGAGVLVLVLLTSHVPAWLSQAFEDVGEQIGEPVGDPTSLNASLLLLVSAFLLLQLAIELAYFVVCELTTGGRSLGKWILGLKVMQDGCRPLGARASVLRNVLRAVDVLPMNYLVGLVAIALSAEGKRLGDLAAGTIVTRLDRPAPAPPLALAEDDAEPRFRFARAQVLRVGPDERALLRQTLRRLDALVPERRAEILARTSEVLSARIGHPPVAEEERLSFLRALARAARVG